MSQKRPRRLKHSNCVLFGFIALYRFRKYKNKYIAFRKSRHHRWIFHMLIIINNHWISFVPSPEHVQIVKAMKWYDIRRYLYVFLFEGIMKWRD